MNIYRWIRWWADRTPDKIAIRFEGDEIRYDEFAQAIDAAAGALQSLGVGDADRVAYLGYNRPEFLTLLFACARIGAMIVPLNFRLAPREHLYMLKNAGARYLFFDPRFDETAAAVSEECGQCGLISIAQDPPTRDLPSLPALMQAHPGGPPVHDDLPPGDSPLLVVYTSGTTGRPKGAVLTQRGLHWNALNSRNMHDLRRTDHVLTTLPFFHVGGLNIQTTPALQAGATVTLIEKFYPGEFLRMIETGRPTLTVLVPTQMQAIAQHAHWQDADLSSLRCVTTGSTIVQVPLLEIWHQHGVPVVQVYGCTESGPIAIHQLAESAHASAGSIGAPALYCDVRLVDDDGHDVADGQPGEIVIRGPNVLKEYWQDPEATALSLRDGWLHTGDVGYRDSRGNYFIVDRKSRMIISGGENIYPSELERILLEHPDIREAVVVGLADERWGEVPVAAVVTREGASLDPACLNDIFEGRVGQLKHPRHCVILDALPRNAMGKVVVREVQSQIAKQLA